MAKRRLATATSGFGSGKRESHDSTSFYERFISPVVSVDEGVAPPVVIDRLFCGDARDMTDDQVANSSVALVVTSPPYFAGKEYETDLAAGHVPSSYVDYLQMLHDVLSACLAKLEPGGRMAVNVANLGRKPYRSLSADIISILQDDLGMLMRGEVIWQKARGAGGSCAWGSYRSPQNPVLRDVTERVVIASKGRFDRALKRSRREAEGLPHEATIGTEEFLEATLDVWEIPSESARKIGHPAPFPVALPQRLIELYTYKGDLVLDPFMGSGSTAVAAARSGRHFVGFDTDETYLALAKDRLAEETA
jgi:site-specific DNA-methyltransferase (adenine-specific)